MSHFLSFIVPCYNVEDTVDETIDSIYAQKLNTPFEIIAVDDGSSDTTMSILAKYRTQNSNFYSYRHDKNRGLGATRNNCIGRSKGDLIFALDADNFLEPLTIGRLISFLDEKNCECASFLEARIFTGVKGKYKVRGHYIPEKLEDGNICDLVNFMKTTRHPASHGNYLYTRKSFDAVGGYPIGKEGTPSGALEALKFGFRQMAMGMKIAMMPDSFYWHRNRSEGKWMRDDKLGVNSMAMVEELRKFPHLFTKKTNRLLAGEELTKGRAFSRMLNKGKLKLK